MSFREPPKTGNRNDSPQHENIFSLHRSVTIVTPQRSNSLDYLNFEEKRQLIASTLSLSEILHCGSTAAHSPKDNLENTTVGKWNIKIFDLLSIAIPFSMSSLILKEMHTFSFMNFSALIAFLLNVKLGSWSRGCEIET